MQLLTIEVNQTWNWTCLISRVWRQQGFFCPLLSCAKRVLPACTISPKSIKARSLTSFGVMVELFWRLVRSVALHYTILRIDPFDLLKDLSFFFNFEVNKTQGVSANCQTIVASWSIRHGSFLSNFFKPRDVLTVISLAVLI